METSTWFIIVVLILCIAVALYLLLLKKSIISGGGDTELVAILVLKTPLAVQEMRKKYIKTDDQPPHITLGYLKCNDDELKGILKHVRSIKPNPIVFEEWKHTKTFIGLMPKNIDEIKRIMGPMEKYVETGPRGGYHMSVAYRPHSAVLDASAHKNAHDDIHVPLICPVKELRIAKKVHNQDWVKYKSFQFF